MTNAVAGQGVSGADNTPRGIMLVICAILIFGVQDAVAKILVQTWSPMQISMMRYWAFGLLSLLLVMRQAPLRQAFKSALPKWQIARGLLLVADIWCFAMAIRTVPLAELQSISMIYPLLVTLIAIPVLGERVGVFRISAILVGFVGVLVILRPGGLAIDEGVYFAITAMVFYGCYIVCTRKVAQVDSTATSMVYVGVIGLVLTSVVGVFFWQPMGWDGVLMAAVVMVTTVTAHTLMMIALRYAPASVLQPFNYLALPWAIVLSIVVFGHMIDFISFIGATIIVGAGLVIWARERQRKVFVADPEVTPAGKE
ncbi:DMT family transporter [Mariluticola halotolerans]|uniref:DMT family transporter n=1 Tax=Mariluticola halotolerans TaxID=2909283 RepID=UPI0026E382C5|nr:DMT family transporter [Mariluticola halotolerans]UJQ94454.1 DMT family transporter [Mariluticola halotolerans]